MDPKNSCAVESPIPIEGRGYVCTTTISTIWSLVLTAGEGGAEALERLCKIYWRPVYAFIRWKRPCDPEDAKDLTQAFFTEILGKQGLKSAHPDKGQFRNFLLEAVTHFLCNEWDKQQTIKRGGRFSFISLDAVMAEDGYPGEPHDERSPEKRFDRKWALTLVEQAQARLRKQYLEDEKCDIFVTMKPFLTEIETKRPYAKWAVELKTSEGACVSSA